MKGRDSNCARIIKFKAKRLDSDEWVEGDLGHSASLNKGVQTYKTTISTPIYTDHGEILGHSVYEVDPSTVCQFTGMKDESGKEIWEHDILKNYPMKSEVIFKNGSFMIIEDRDGYTVEFPLSELIYDDGICYLESIGSKFDRKEGEDNDICSD